MKDSRSLKVVLLIVSLRVLTGWRLHVPLVVEKVQTSLEGLRVDVVLSATYHTLDVATVPTPLLDEKLTVHGR